MNSYSPGGKNIILAFPEQDVRGETSHQLHLLIHDHLKHELRLFLSVSDKELISYTS